MRKLLLIAWIAAFSLAFITYPVVGFITGSATDAYLIAAHDETRVSGERELFNFDPPKADKASPQYRKAVISIYGTLVTDEMTRFVFVPKEKFLHPKELPELTLLPVDKNKGENPLQAKTVSFFAPRLMLGFAAGGFALCILWIILQRKAKAAAPTASGGMRAALALALLAGCASPPPRNPADLDADFLRDDSRWRGGDAVYSVPLGGDRFLWLFGDSFIAAPGVTNRAGSRMIRNSLAITKGGGRPEYFWPSEGGQPADAFKPESGEGWLWPLSGQRIGPRLHLFMFQMIAKGEGAFGFAFLKSVLLTVDNPDDDPASWRTSQLTIPHTIRSTEGDTFFGGASVLHEGKLYVYGVRESRANGKAILVAKVDSATIADFGTWRFFNGKLWDKELRSAQELYVGGSIEMSVSPFKDGFVAVYTQQGMSPEIVVRRAPHPAGPWSGSVVVHRCVEPQWSRNYFCYAAKAHPELAATDRELIVSYACNSLSFPEAVRDQRIYRPRFLRIPLE